MEKQRTKSSRELDRTRRSEPGLSTLPPRAVRQLGTPPATSLRCVPTEPQDGLGLEVTTLGLGVCQGLAVSHAHECLRRETWSPGTYYTQPDRTRSRNVLGRKAPSLVCGLASTVHSRRGAGPGVRLPLPTCSSPDIL